MQHRPATDFFSIGKFLSTNASAPNAASARYLCVEIGGGGGGGGVPPGGGQKKKKRYLGVPKK